MDDVELFYQELEDDKDMRSQINIYKDPDADLRAKKRSKQSRAGSGEKAKAAGGRQKPPAAAAPQPRAKVARSGTSTAVESRAPVMDDGEWEDVDGDVEDDATTTAVSPLRLLLARGHPQLSSRAPLSWTTASGKTWTAMLKTTPQPLPAKTTMPLKLGLRSCLTG
eukprot:TRINITY_DN1784_c0_g1_i5.p1 TRINITY_DN1784_c0_g1~~TRINITY_DN1784_c0_g1_i5.p1  ORF type:complete len:166 (+),score=25.46 TRINITY_DN1784_c0_g1_i5:282-779(+)